MADHLADALKDDLLCLILRRHRLSFAANRPGQGLFIYLLILVQRDGVQLHGHGRHHIGRLFRTDEGMERINIHYIIGDNVGSEILFPCTRILKGLHRCVLNAWELSDNPLHLGQLNSESPHLNLSVVSPDEVHLATGQQAHYIAAAVGASVPLLIGEGIGNKCLFCQIRAIQVAFGHARTGNQQLTGNQRRQATAVFVHHIDLVVVEGFSNGNALIKPVHALCSGINGAFRGTIAIVERGSTLHGRERYQLLTASGEKAQSFHVGHCVELPSHLGGHERMGNGVTVEISLQLQQIQPDFLLDDIDTGSGGQCRIEIHHVRIETVAGVSRHAACLVQIIKGPVPGTEVGKVFMHKLDSLWRAG